MLVIDDLVPVFQLQVREDNLAGGLTVSYKGRTIVLTPDQAVASVGGRLVSLSSAVVRDGRRWLVPLDFLSRALSLVYDSRLEFRRASRLVILGDVRVPRVVARQEPNGTQTRITFEITPKATETVVQEPGRLLVRLDADAIDATLPTTNVPGLVESIRVADPGNVIAIVLGPRFATFRATAVPGDTTTRVVIDLTAASGVAPPGQAQPQPGPPPLGAPGTPPPAAPPGAPSATAPPALGAQTTPSVRTVILDPGHGGTEDGTRGASGTLEKDITLTIARRLKSVLESRLGLRVLLTREGDTLVPLDERAALANNNQADLFVSLHANASLRNDVAGAQVYYLSTDSVIDPTRQAAAGQTLPALGGGSREINVLLWEMAQTKHLAASAAFAGMVQEELAKHVPMNGRPVQQAPLRVLVGANMPAILVEMAFLSNAAQEDQLRSTEFQNQLVQSLFDAIVRFRDSVERGHGTSGSPAPSSPASAPGRGGSSRH
jgi:N-acetylmuramoyl-L-alanine amidase